MLHTQTPSCEFIIIDLNFSLPFAMPLFWKQSNQLRITCQKLSESQMINLEKLHLGVAWWTLYCKAGTL